MFVFNNANCKIDFYLFFFQRRSLRSPRKMDRLRRSFRDSFRRRKERVPESSKPHQWQADESAVRSGTCTFAVKYLGCVEVFESRGMQVCEEALKVLRVSPVCFFFCRLSYSRIFGYTMVFGKTIRGLLG